VVAAVSTGAFMGQLDASIVTLSFPTLRHTFGASLASVQWVGQAYLLVLIGTLTAIGRYADMVGRKLLYTYGFVIFLIGSALCGAAPSLGLLVGFRVIQGIGAAMLQANSVAIIAGSTPRHQLGRAIGIQGAAQALGLALGPPVGGFLIGAGSWRLIFLVNVPIGVAGTVLAWLLVPRSRDLAPRTRYDWVGLGLFLPAMTALLLAISYGDHLGWGSPAIVAGFVAAAGLLALFLWRERRTPNPMLDLGLFRRRPFRAGVASGLLAYLVLFGSLTVVPFLLEIGHQQSTQAAGSELLLLPLGVGLAAPIAGWLSDRVGPRPLTAGGMAVAAAALALSAAVRTDLAPLLVTLAAAGIGLGTFTPPNNAAVMAAAPREHAGMAGGIVNVTRGLGTSLGLALAGLVYTIGAGSGVVSPAGAVRGYSGAAVFLAAVAAGSAVIAALRGSDGAGRARWRPLRSPGDLRS
jgi:EmrB/QacA subfamily drug resistance transporter